METRVLRWLGAAVGVMLPAALLGGLFLPVYSDEIGWRFQERAGFDGVDKMFSEACGPNTLAVPPWFMMPVRWYSALLNGAFADPFWIRISGVLYALLWVGLVWLLIRRVTERGQGRSIVTVLGLGLLALGTMPLLMVWSRPEQPIMLAVAGALLQVFRAQGASAAPRAVWVRSLVVTVLYGIAISYHVKGLFILPLMLACLVFVGRGRAAKLVAGALMLAATVSAMSYWSHRMACPADPILRHAYAQNNLSAAVPEISSVGDAVQLLGRMANNAGLFLYLKDTGPQASPLAAWLESGQIGTDAAFVWFLTICLAWVLALVPALWATATALIRCFRERRLDPRPVLALLAFGIALAWSAMQLIQNMYESKFILPMLALGIVLGLASRKPGDAKPGLVVAAAFVGLFAAVSPIAIGAIYAPSFHRAAQQDGYLAAQRYSVSLFGHARLKPQIEAAARLCGIADPAKAHAVMIDDLTYFTFMRSRLPQHKLGILPGGWNGQITDPVAYLKSRGSDGAVLGCHQLSPAERARAKKVGDFCCLGPPNW